NADTTASRRSPEPRPWRAETTKTWPRPSDHNSAAAGSCAMESTLLATTITGLGERRRISTTPASSSVTPVWTSTTNNTRSARSTAASAWRVTASAMGVPGRASHPPVSITLQRRPVAQGALDVGSRQQPGDPDVPAEELVPHRNDLDAGAVEHRPDHPRAELRRQHHRGLGPRTGAITPVGGPARACAIAIGGR